MKIEFEKICIGRRFKYRGKNCLKTGEYWYINKSSSYQWEMLDIKEMVTLIDTCEHCEYYSKTDHVVHSLAQILRRKKKMKIKSLDELEDLTEIVHSCDILDIENWHYHSDDKDETKRLIESYRRIVKKYDEEQEKE